MKKVIVPLLCFILVCAVSGTAIALSSAPASDMDIADRVLEEVTGMFTDIYTISDATALVSDATTNDDGSVTYSVDVSFKRTLKAATAEETPVIQALQAAKAQLNSASEIAAVDDYIDSRILDLEGNYIGVAQDTTGTFQITLSSVARSSANTDNTVSVSNIEMVSEFGDTTVPSASIAPISASEQTSICADIVADIAASALATRSSTTAVPSSAILHYDRVAARDYARTYSCNSGLIGRHGCENPDYDYQNTDCCNFVSQCIHEGGLPTDDVWYPYSTSWNTTGNVYYGIRDYMVDYGHFFHTTSIGKAFAGSIINLLNSNGTNAGHVGLIDQNDGSTVTLCAHDSCCNSYLVSNWTYKDYFVPYWDSYGNTYVYP